MIIDLLKDSNQANKGYTKTMQFDFVESQRNFNINHKSNQGLILLKFKVCFAVNNLVSMANK